MTAQHKPAEHGRGEVVELLPCPFCGDKAMIGGGGDYNVCCSSCPASVVGDTDADAAANWNCRAAIAALSQPKGDGDRCLHGVRFPHECKDCANSVTDVETDQSIRADCYDMIAEILEDNNMVGGSVVDAVQDLVERVQKAEAALSLPRQSEADQGHVIDEMVDRAWDAYHQVYDAEYHLTGQPTDNSRAAMRAALETVWNSNAGGLR